MKVLVTNNTLRDIGGSETYAYSLIKELDKRSDIEVTGFSKQLGKISNLLASDGIKIVDKVDDVYELVLASHTSTIAFLKDIKAKRIQTCHGIYPPLEQPSPIVDIRVSISNEVFNHLKNKGYDSTIIHNGVNCDRFKPVNKLNKSVKNILSLSQSHELNIKLKNICDTLNIGFKSLNKFKNPIFNVENEINKADLVISLGRGVYESMACGRNVLILDKRPYVIGPPLGDGLITDKNIDKFILNNCSGRYSKHIYTDDEIINEINKYDPKLGEFNREYALQNLNIKLQVDKYLNL